MSLSLKQEPYLSMEFKSFFSLKKDIYTGKQDKNTEEEHHFFAVWSEGTVKVISIF